MNLTCSILLLLFVAPFVCKAQTPAARLGIYDFTGNTASEFYLLAPAVMADFTLWKKAQMDLRITPSLAFNVTRYNSHYHYLCMLPLFTTVFYNLPNPGSGISPSFGTGISVLGKADYNKDYAKTHYSLAYGFHASFRLNFLLKNRRSFMLDMTYNLLVPPVREEVNMSGVILSAGIDFPVGRKRTGD